MTTVASPPTASAATAMPTPAAKRPVFVLGALFVIASIAGGVGLTLSFWLLR